MKAKVTWSVLLVLLFIGFIFSQEIFRNLTKWISVSQDFEENHYKEYTSPLPNSVQKDLCMKLELSNSNELCESENLVYAGEFYPAIEEHFKSKNDNLDDFQYAIDLFEKYLIECVQPNGTEGDKLINCTFDFRGDGRFPILFLFEQDGNLDAIRWDLVDF